MKIVIFTAYGFITMLLNPLLWGVTFYALFILITRSDRKWIIGGIASSLLFFLWDEIVCVQIMGAVGMSMGDEDIADFVGTDVWTTSVADAGISVGLAFAGFAVGRMIIRGACNALKPT